MTDKDENLAPFAFEGLDRLFHEKARLGILTSLMTYPEGIGFTQLKALCGLTDGNLSRHMQILEEAGMVELRKGYEGKRPHTHCSLTEEGRRGFSNYLKVLEGVLRGAASADNAEQDSRSDDKSSPLSLSPKTA